MQELEEKRKNKKRKEANESLNKYPGLSFNPEIELRKWEVFEQQKQQMMEVRNGPSLRHRYLTSYVFIELK